MVELLVRLLLIMSSTVRRLLVLTALLFLVKLIWVVNTQLFQSFRTIYFYFFLYKLEMLKCLESIGDWEKSQ